VKYVGLDWAYRTAQWCALDLGGEIAGEGRISADRDGLARLVLELGDEVKETPVFAHSNSRLERGYASPLGPNARERAGLSAMPDESWAAAEDRERAARSYRVAGVTRYG